MSADEPRARVPADMRACDCFATLAEGMQIRLIWLSDLRECMRKIRVYVAAGTGSRLCFALLTAS